MHLFFLIRTIISTAANAVQSLDKCNISHAFSIKIYHFLFHDLLPFLYNALDQNLQEWNASVEHNLGVLLVCVPLLSVSSVCSLFPVLLC